MPGGIEVAPTITVATARPYTQYRALSPTGDGSLQILCPSGNSNDVGFGAGQVPCGINNARGDALYNANARLTKNIAIAERKLALFAEFYNIFNHANFGNQYFGNAFAPAVYGKPSGFIGGSVGSISRLTRVCKSTMMRAARTTGSIVVCGAEPCPPLPRTVMSTMSMLAIARPGVNAMWPHGCCGSQCRARQ